ncbi:benzoate 4-monooxygenase cytochrome P450 [Podospora conica]|nr:benzoate 4-monooxygenase cytochrome P450 [Schizothecium conicum]
MMRHVGVVRRLAMLAPLLADWLGEDMRRVMHLLRVVVPGFVKKAIEHPDGDGRVFAQLVEANPGILEDDKGGLGVDWMVGEGFNFLLAGTETTAANLTVIVFWLLAKPEIHARLMEELGDLTPETLRWTDLENRPYMWALVHESLRVMPGITARTARIARDEDLVYESQDGKVQWVIPRGTPIGMSPIINHHDKELFPNSDEFDPDRWLVDGQRNFALAKNLMAFGKGSRSCLGENLAYCELYIMTAMMAMRVIPRARLSGTTAEDLAYDHDMFVLQNKKGGPISVHIEVVEA